ncbi:MAG TPA: homogentisate 1,2-dioxygenase [Polyangiaceae bacterium]|nr:homogentisate 1,2-dioxygenase [Polyangiaceae bacterium]
MLERRSFGDLPAKPHTALRSVGTGALRYEECITRAGFDGPYSIVYHEQRPHEAEPISVTHGWELLGGRPQRALVRHHFRSFEQRKRAGAPLDARVPLLENDDLVISVLAPDAEDPAYFVNADGDQLLFVREGGGLLKTQLGDLRFGVNDYVCLPRGLLHRFVPDPATVQDWLLIESVGAIAIPRQYRNEIGQLRMDAPYSHRDFRAPEFSGPSDEGIRKLLVKRGGSFFGFRYARSPLDVVGWDGTYYPFAFSILDFQAKVGMVHLPPTVHATFAFPGGLVCSFVPRPLDYHPQAMVCPYPHSSVDIDEVIYYVRGNFTSRKGISPGSISLHPAGIPHGPHPGAYEETVGGGRTEELAVMLDCARPLRVTSAALAIDDPSYHHSFVDPGGSHSIG